MVAPRLGKIRPGAWRWRWTRSLDRMGLRAGAVAVGLLPYLVLVAAGTSACLAAIVYASYLVLWRGLEFPANERLAVQLLTAGALLFLTGMLLHRYGNRLPVPARVPKASRPALRREWGEEGSNESPSTGAPSRSRRRRQAPKDLPQPQ